ncbi:TetR/AcrR family transcriptional regulator [Coraliomargarita sp. W4R53]
MINEINFIQPHNLNQQKSDMTVIEKQQNHAILQAAGALFAETGFGQVDVETIAQRAEVDPSVIYSEFTDKTELCQVWLISLHQHAETHHLKILQSEADPIEKIRVYFESLADWMKESGYAGCPFTRTLNSLGTKASPAIRQEVRMHKEFVADFFVTLASDIAVNKKEAERLGQQLFLLYSGATTEAKNLESAWPIESAKEIALATCEAAREGKRLSINKVAS